MENIIHRWKITMIKHLEMKLRQIWKILFTVEKFWRVSVFYDWILKANRYQPDICGVKNHLIKIWRTYYYNTHSKQKIINMIKILTDTRYHQSSARAQEKSIRVVKVAHLIISRDIWSQRYETHQYPPFVGKHDTLVQKLFNCWKWHNNYHKKSSILFVRSLFFNWFTQPFFSI